MANKLWAIFCIMLFGASTVFALAPTPECQTGCAYQFSAIGISRTNNNVLDFPLELDNTSNINTLLGPNSNYPNTLPIKSGDKLAISWNVINEPANANYSVSYGCSNTIQGIKETTQITNTTEYPIFWTVPNTNCYCRFWIRMKNGLQTLAGAMSRPFNICSSRITVTNFVPTATSSPLTYFNSREDVSAHDASDNPRKFKITTQVTPSDDCKVGHAIITYKMLENQPIETEGTSVIYDNEKYPRIPGTEDPAMVTSASGWDHCPNGTPGINQICRVDPNIDYFFKVDVDLTKVPGNTKRLFENKWKADPNEECAVAVFDISGQPAGEMSCPVVEFNCPAATTTGTSSILVITESVVTKSPTPNQATLKASVWTSEGKPIMVKTWFVFKVAGEATSSKTQDVFQKSNSSFSTVVAYNPNKAYCFTPYAQKVTDDTQHNPIGNVFSGSELCYPKIPWVKTLDYSLDKTKATFNGQITNFNNNASVSTWFKYYLKGQESQAQETAKKNTSASSNPFSDSVTLATSTSDQTHCYKACAGITPQAFNCGQEKCFVIKGEGVEDSKTATWMFYFAWDNDIGSRTDRIQWKTICQAYDSNQEMKKKFKLVFFYDGPNNGDTEILACDGAEAKSLKKLGEKNCGDYLVLQEFIDYSITNYPSSQYYLTISNHGGGYGTGANITPAAFHYQSAGKLQLLPTNIAYDQTEFKYITDNQENKVLADIRKKYNFDKFEMIMHQACLMQQLESLDYLQDDAKNIIGAWDLSSWPMTIFNEMFEQMPTAAMVDGNSVGGWMIDSLDDLNYSWQFDYSSAKTVGIPEITTAVNELSLELIKYLDSDAQAKTILRSIFNKAPKINDGYPGESASLGYVNLPKLLEAITQSPSVNSQAVKQAAQKSLDAHNKYVSYHTQSSMSGYRVGGLGIQGGVGEDKNEFILRSASEYSQLPFAQKTKWGEFLVKLWQESLSPTSFQVTAQPKYASSTIFTWPNTGGFEKIKFDSEITPSDDCKIGHAKLTYTQLDGETVDGYFTMLHYEDDLYPFIDGTDNPKMNVESGGGEKYAWMHDCPTPTSSNAKCLLEKNKPYSYEFDIDLTKVPGNNKVVFVDKDGEDPPFRGCGFTAHNGMFGYLDCPVIKFTCPATLGSMPVDKDPNLLVMTEKGKYTTSSKSLSMSFSIWPLTKKNETVQWWIKVYKKDKDGNMSEEFQMPPQSGEDFFIQYPNGNHMITRNTPNTLTPLPAGSSWCFRPYAQFKNTNTILVSWGQELCFPDNLWVITRNPGLNPDSAVASLNGAITNFSGHKKVNAWFEMINPLSPNPIMKTFPPQPIKIDAVNPVPKFGVTFSDKRAIITLWPFYRACAQGEGSLTKVCGDTYPLSYEDIRWPWVSTTMFVVQGNTTTYNGFLNNYDSKAQCFFKVFPKGKPNSSSAIYFKPALLKPDGKFSFKDSGFNFKRSNYCYKAYCSLYGIDYGAAFSICSDGTSVRDEF